MNIRYINIKQNKTKQNTALFQEMVVTFALPITYVKGFLAPRQWGPAVNGKVKRLQLIADKKALVEISQNHSGGRECPW